ncbi:LysR family transcriptional regulator [Streptomyces rimosus]|uniref:LysR family transcriptional regulator n=1 Tax=Streptomyces rimosus TaxID=1927 RepID=UPI00099D81E0|nr:LysR family transcriptional regulator [Streptomyces rimosus]
MNIEIQDLRVLRAVAESGSLAGAARSLGVNQAGVTRRIQHLERVTELVVLHRDHQGARLTAAGRLLLRWADDLLPKVDRLLTACGREGIPGPSAERLRIGAVPTPALPLITSLLRAHLPSTAIEPRTVGDTLREAACEAPAAGHGTALPDLFRSHCLDLAVVRHCVALDAPLPALFGSAVLAEENLLIGTVAGHRLAGRPSLLLGDLDGETCLLVGGRRHADLRRHFTAAVRHAGVRVWLRWASDEAEAAALACALPGVLPAYPLPAPKAGMIYTPLTDDRTRHRLLLVWEADGPAADWAPGLADLVRETYRRADQA